MLEAIVQNVEDAIKAEKAGIDRLELVSSIERDGLTPSTDITKQILEHVTIPVQVMIRPHDRGFCYSHRDLKTILESIEEMMSIGASRFVLGGLKEDFTIDQILIEKVIVTYPSINITFHRAIDYSSDLRQSYEILSMYKSHIKMILTSGGAPNCEEGIDALRELVRLSEEINGPIIMPGAGITPTNFAHIHKKVHASEYHFGKGVRLNQSFDCEFDVGRILELKKALNNKEV
ncbi:copper homeostasis protein CutC [Gracilibacillus saliphilus]|uniref:copper homeostasis protein CutC n=1 Tax=Gracilibacillus saliphilus TaxID=543890 RepID=UPI0013D1142B|nr:copper homeostasis protein CutC [Gracilibacillus saliphilus]